MQFVIILRETHVSDQVPVAHTWLTMAIIEQKEVIRINRELFLRKLCSISTPFLYNYIC